MSSFVCDIPSDVSVPPRFIVNLDLSPALRWQHILRLYIDQFREVEKKIDSMITDIIGQFAGPMLEKILSTIMSGITRLGLVYYGQELKGFSEITGIPLGKLVLIQFVYECFACCTSIVCKDEQNNIPIHIRTMDWELDFLKPLTIDVDFQKNGQTIFKATTWVGYVGILTGMRTQDGYSVSVNFRHTGGSLGTNLKTALTAGWPIGFLVREVLESTHTYDIAVEQLAQSSIIAPCYFTICGTSQCRTFGTLLTRKQASEEKRWTVSDHGSIVQTNIDHWSSDNNEDILYSIKRRSLSRNVLDEMKPINEYELWKLISEYPICNKITIYGTFMCPEYNIYHTRYPQDNVQFMSKEKPQFIPMADIKDNVSSLLSSTHICHKCEREFNIDDNIGGNCKHIGTWHSKYNDCSYLKCGFNLGKTASIGQQHWSCCYSLDRESDTCIDPRVETREEVCERVLEAAKYIPIEQLGTTDDCGFSPFDNDQLTPRQIAFDKIRARLEGTRMAEEQLMARKRTKI
ncbi:unnamed protein product [Adineta steineri]|uniref:Acid ceramidase-like protein n=2 Tax=Adineta steineri TaxID=433720 RepID=A0A813W1N9_9BILA|nr:unnamed protein product [Adineta steineri]